MAVVLERFVVTAGGISKVSHCLLNVVVYRVVPRVCGFARLEIGIRVCGGAANDRMLWVQRAGAMCGDFILRQQPADGVIRQWHDFVDFVRGAETVEEMNKRHAAFQRGDM